MHFTGTNSSCPLIVVFRQISGHCHVRDKITLLAEYQAVSINLSSVMSFVALILTRLGLGPI